MISFRSRRLLEHFARALATVAFAAGWVSWAASAGAAPLGAAGARVGVPPQAFAAVGPDIDVYFGQPNVSQPVLTLCGNGTAVHDGVVLNPLNGYAGTPSVQFTQVPTTLKVNPLVFAPAAMPPGQVLDFTVATASTTPPTGPQYLVLGVTDVSQSIVKSAVLTVNVAPPDFTGAVVPGSVSVEAGGAAQTFAASTSPASCALPGVSVTVTPSTSTTGITISPASGQTSAGGRPVLFAVRAATGVRPGTYPVTFTFTAGSIVHTVNGSVTVTPAAPRPTFNFTLSPNPLNLATGGTTGAVTVTTLPDPNFTALITYSITGLPSTFTVDRPKTVGAPYAAVSFNITADPSTPIGTYAGTVTGSVFSGTSKMQSLVVTVQALAADVDVGFTSDTMNVCNFGPPVTNSVKLVPLAGYSGTLTLRFGGFDGLPAGLTVNLASTTVTLPPAQTVPFTVTASGAFSGPLSATLSVSDSSQIAKSANLTVQVDQPTFVTLFNPPAVSLEPGGASQSIAISVTGGSHCFTSQSIALAVSDTPQGVHVTPGSATLTGPAFGPATFTFQADRNATPGTFPVSFQFTPSDSLPGKVVQAIVTIQAITCKPPDAPVSPTIAPDGNPNAPVTATDYLALRWAATATGTPPTRYEYRINGGPYASTAATSAVAPPRASDLNPIQLFVRAYGCDPEQVSGEASSPVYSLAPPVADFTAPSSASVGSTVTFTDTSFPQATSWLWVFDDGTPPGTTQAQTHVFQTAGTHEVALIATNGSGSSLKKKSIQITSSAAPTTPAFTFRRVDEGSPDRQVAPRVAIRPGQRTLLLLESSAPAGYEVTVFLRFLDERGALVLERRLVIDPSALSMFDLGAFATGLYTVELVSGQPFTATLVEEAGWDGGAPPQEKGDR